MVISTNSHPIKHDTEQVQTKIESKAGTYAVAYSSGLLIFTIILAVFGVIMVFSSSSVEVLNAGKNPFVELLKDSMYLLVGLFSLFIASKLPWAFYQKFSIWFLVVALFLQSLILVDQFSVTIGGNTNWINVFGLFTFQPSEILKLALILWLADRLYRVRNRMDDLKAVFWPSMLGVIAAGALILVGRDLGTVLILAVIVACVYLAAGLRLRWIALGLIGAIGLLFLGFVLPNPTRMERIMSTFSACEIDPQGVGFQMCHSMYSLGSGGIWGVGLGESRQKWSYLPQASSDFILAIIGEELGLVGTGAVILLFGLLGLFLYWSIRLMRNQFQRITTAGIMCWIIFQAVINIFVVVGLFPVVGLPLPFVSSGGSSLVVSLISIGIVLSFVNSYRDAKVKTVKEKPVVLIKT
ncbi:MAG: putative lipid II flippase FtsW [Bifidobacteriaceae bacterium]|jgi:cell division protein FtsW|nr:putative lipid II flippase FtsW [Bifidobacteriaceae bacterium]